MSVVIRRDHPSGSVGLSVATFPDDGNAVLGMGPLKNMKFFTLSTAEVAEVSDALSDAYSDLRRAARGE